jgi:hypothetical protein
MSSWGNNDNSANAPLWATSTINLAPTRGNVANLYSNTTANVFINRATIGLFAVDSSEAANNQNKGVSHTGWVTKTTGQGGRAGRTQYETLVVLNTVIGDGDSTIIANTANPS